jgi:hypothetical protein
VRYCKGGIRNPLWTREGGPNQPPSPSSLSLPDSSNALRLTVISNERKALLAAHHVRRSVCLILRSN